MKARKIYIEGGGNRDEVRISCRKAFTRLFEKAGFKGRMPQTIPCGGRDTAFARFKAAHESSTSGDFIAMLIDSEDPVTDIEKTWDHLKRRDHWEKPADASDEQVLFMTTCMETWIVADRAALRRRYGQKLHENALPPLENLESRSRDEVQKKLCAAAPYAKGKQSFDVLQTLNPSALNALPSFARTIRILRARLLH